MIALRNRITHGYGSIDWNIVWEIVKDELPALIRQLNSILGESDAP